MTAPQASSGTVRQVLLETVAVVVGLPLALALGCSSSGSPGGQPAASSSSSTPKPSASSTASAVPTTMAAIPVAKVKEALNPKGQPPYSGPTGTLKGIVKVKGDDPPTRSFNYPEGCGEAQATYGKLFRVGQDQTLGDVLVAVTGYEGFVPPTKDSVQVTIRGCAYSTRTIGLTYGQFISVQNQDPPRSYLPYLEGTRGQQAGLVAMAWGDPVKMYLPEPRVYQLADEMSRPWMIANVFVLRYSTFAVTGLDGRYEIGGIPVGKVQVSALLADAKMKAVNQALDIKAGDNSLDITIDFDAQKDTPK
jgi:hypothetical protein